VLDPLWDDVRRVSWRWEDRGCEAGSALPAPPHPAPALDPTPAIQSLYGGLKWFARTSGAAGLTDALTRAIPHLLAEQARQGAPFGEQVRADALQKGGHAAPIDAGGDGPDPFAAAMAQIRTSDGTAGLPATPSDVAEELRRELTVLAALLAAAGEGRPWTAAFQRLYREADALCPFRLYAQPDGSQRLGRHAADPWAYARLVALLKMPSSSRTSSETCRTPTRCSAAIRHPWLGREVGGPRLQGDAGVSPGLPGPTHGAVEPLQQVPDRAQVLHIAFP